MSQRAQVTIPSDWDGESTLCVCVSWPDSTEWLGVLWGLLTSPTRGRFWDAETGSIVGAQEVGWQIYEANMALKECGGSGSLISMSAALYADLSQTTIRNYPTTIIDPTDVNTGAPNRSWTLADGDTSGDVTKREAALCIAVRRIVDAACDSEITRRELGAVGIDAVAGIIGVGLAFAGPAAAALGGLLLVGLSTAAGAFAAISESVLSDDDAREDVACCLYQSLRGQYPNEDSLTYGLSRCCFGGTSNAAQIAGAIAPVLPGLLPALLDFLAEAKKELLLPDCPCDQDAWWWALEGNVSGPSARVFRTGTHVLRVETGAESRPFGTNKRVIAETKAALSGPRPLGVVDITGVTDGGPTPYVVYAYSHSQGYREKGIHPFPWLECYQVAIDGPDGDGPPGCWAEISIDPANDCLYLP